MGQLRFDALGPRHLCECNHAAVTHKGFSRECDDCGCGRYVEAKRW